MTAGPSGDDKDADLDRLTRQYPQWRIWRGRATGDYWAMPPPGHPAVRELISSSDISELARRLAEAEGRHGTHKGHHCQEGVRIWPGGYARRRAGLTVLLDPSL